VFVQLVYQIIHPNGGFTFVWFSIKTLVFPIIAVELIWFIWRVSHLDRKANILEQWVLRSSLLSSTCYLISILKLTLVPCSLKTFLSCMHTWYFECWKFGIFKAILIIAASFFTWFNICRSCWSALRNLRLLTLYFFLNSNGEGFSMSNTSGGDRQSRLFSPRHLVEVCYQDLLLVETWYFII
jgi:Wnt-binding factor required for Wnt secretion